MYCIYRHIRKDNNSIFYVGIGNKNRPYDKRMRSNFWNRIVNKTDYIVEILENNLTWEKACELECLIISIYGRRNNNTGILCNLTDGGEGGYGTIISNSTKNKMRKAKLNKVSNSSKQIINIITGEIFDSIKVASNNLNIKRTTLNAQLSGQNKNKTNLKYLENGCS